MKTLALIFTLVALPAFGEISVKPNKLPGMLSSEISAPNDLMMVWDNSAGLLKKITLTQLDTRWSGGGGGGSTVWGDITGTLSAQTDLQSALNAKQNSISSGNLTSSTTGLTVTGGSGSVIGSGTSLAIQTASGSQPGLLSAADWTTFNGKQGSGNYITALTGDVSASGAGSASATVNSVGGSTASNINLAEVLANAATASNTNSTIVKRDGSGNFTASTITAALTGAVTGNASTATALAANPADCSANTYATTIAASGALTCASITNASTTATNANTVSTIVARDGSGNFSAGTISAALTGNASTATALAANPSACSAGTYASDIDANGTLTCVNPLTGMVESYTGHIETAANKTYVIDEYASFAKQITNIRIACSTSGTVTAALKIGGTNITTCNGIAVTSSAATTTCDTGVTNDLAANGRLTLATTSNSACLDLTFTIKTARD